MHACVYSYVHTYVAICVLMSSKNRLAEALNRICLSEVESRLSCGTKD